MTYNGYTASQLFAAAKVAGLALYGPANAIDGWYNTGLVFDDDDSDIIMYEMSALGSEDLDSQNGDITCPYTDDYEFQFHPSTSKGVDCGAELIRTLTPDVDGHVYLYGPGYGIRIILNVITSRED